jgi:hypothetical protein
LLRIGDTYRANMIFLYTWMTTTLEINNQVNETSGIIIELKVTSQAVSFIKQILGFCRQTVIISLWCWINPSISKHLVRVHDL